MRHLYSVWVYESFKQRMVLCVIYTAYGFMSHLNSVW